MPEVRLWGLLLVLFAGYLIMLAYFLFFAGWYDHTTGIRGTFHYNLVPFKEIRRFIAARHQLSAGAVFLNLFGNILGFLPMGFFLPVLFPRLRRIWLTVCFGAVLSFGAEAVQLVTMTGNFDVDDIILNTLGTLFGYPFFALFRIHAIRSAGRLTAARARKKKKLYPRK